MADEKDTKKQAAPTEAAEAPAEAKAKKEKKGDDKKEEKEKKKGPPSQKVKRDYGPDFRYIVRIANSDLDGTKQAMLALTGIKGIGHRMATVVCDVAGVPRSERIGKFSDGQIESVAKAVDTLAQHVPTWAVNRQFDVESGADLHLVGTGIDIVLRDDLNRLKKIRSYKGVRHEAGQKVRGQRSKANGRTGLTMGVQRTKAAEATAPKAEEGKPGAAPAAAPKVAGGGSKPLAGAAPKAAAPAAGAAKPAAKPEAKK